MLSFSYIYLLCSDPIDHPLIIPFYRSGSENFNFQKKPPVVGGFIYLLLKRLN